MIVRYTQIMFQLPDIIKDRWHITVTQRSALSSRCCLLQPSSLMQEES